MSGEVRVITRDGHLVRQFKCPGCGSWGDIDDDQFNGRVSIDHTGDRCSFHETVDLHDAQRRERAARAVAGGEPTRPSEQEWCDVLSTQTEYYDETHELLAAIAPLIERERADAAARVVAAVEALHRASPPDRPLSPLSEDFRLGYNAALDKAVRAARGATGGKT